MIYKASINTQEQLNFHVQTEYEKIRTRKNSELEHFSRSVNLIPLLVFVAF